MREEGAFNILTAFNTIQTIIERNCLRWGFTYGLGNRELLT